jgi:hypothetical protein
MKSQTLLTTAIAALSCSLGAADSKDDLAAAAKKLADKDNYSWRTTVAVPDDAQFKPGPTEGKTEKDGYTWLSISFMDNEILAVLKGDKGVIKPSDGDWQTLSEMAKAEGFERFVAMRLQTFKAPAAQVPQLVSFAKELKKDGDTYSSEMTEDGAKTLLSFRPGSSDAPSASNTKGSMKFWLKDGQLTKYEFVVKGTMNFGGNEMDVDRTSTVIIKDIGATKVTVPEAAKKKLS